MNALDNLAQALEQGSNEVMVNPTLANRALLPLQRMLDFKNSAGA